MASSGTRLNPSSILRKIRRIASPSVAATCCSDIFSRLTHLKALPELWFVKLLDRTIWITDRTCFGALDEQAITADFEDKGRKGNRSQYRSHSTRMTGILGYAYSR